jgi:hypothetical protein
MCTYCWLLAARSGLLLLLLLGLLSAANITAAIHCCLLLPSLPCFTAAFTAWQGSGGSQVGENLA